MPEEKTTSSPSETKERAMGLVTRILSKADALYNKLPLDAINEKLTGKGIKVDVKKRSFKLALSGIVTVLVILLVCLVFCGGNDNNTDGTTVAKGGSSKKVDYSKATYPGNVNNYHLFYTDEGLAFFKSLRPCYREWKCAFDCLVEMVEKGMISLKGIVEPGKSLYDCWKGKTASEVISFDRELWGEKGEELYQKKLAEFKPEESQRIYEIQLSMHEDKNLHLHYIQENFLSVFSQRLGEIRSVFKVVSLETVYLGAHSSDDSDEVWRGKCKLHDTETGAEFLENYACSIDWDHSGDRKYYSNSFERPITLHWLWLHDIGKNNYLADP
ncbi:MAG: hypothetical protein IKP00_02520 [Victivallales bacterium]|nr:hypothetical protein [Victivallales bacterium]